VAQHRGAKEITLDGLLFLVHSLIAAIGVPVAASILRYSILFLLQQFYPSIAVSAGNRMHWILLQTPYFPAQIVIGLLLGFQVGAECWNRLRGDWMESLQVGFELFIIRSLHKS
jgi:hypothetical protein